MRLAALIKRLQKLEAKHGPEVHVCVPDWGNRHSHFGKATSARAVLVKPHYGGFYLTDDIKDGGYGGGGAFTQPYQRQILARPDQTIILIDNPS